jgi:hypothetical protein
VIINSPLLAKKIFPAAALIILLLLAGLGAVFYFTRIGPADDAIRENPGSAAAEAQNVSPADADSKAAEIPGPAGQTASGAAPSGQDSGSVVSPGATEPPASDPAPQTLAGENDAPGETAAPTAEPVPPTGTTGAGASPPSPASSLPRGEYAHRIMVSAVSGNCWVDVKFDNSSRSVELQSGRTSFWDFQERATVLLGNAAAVKLFYDGKEIMFRAGEGEVKSFRFP